jgi:hypothetical protein
LNGKGRKLHYDEKNEKVQIGKCKSKEKMDPRLRGDDRIRWWAELTEQTDRERSVF